MRLILFFLGGFMLANLVVAGSSMIRPQAHEQQRMFRDANKSAPAPWTANERYIEPTRKNARRSALDALAMPLAVACSSTGRAQIVDALAFYYGQRAAQRRKYAEAWGADGGRFAEKAWATTDDGRVERLTRETFSRGYFSLDDFGARARELIAETVSGESAPATACAAG
ncbi:MAG: hypothetical protein KJZ73_14315 [Pseudorhodoplanes sp.]|nr:hypothetical protein [Pseudorhodoplanes sp.]MBW7947957.1 hypothetical protein [Pseudorhodoplanes sp.]MCL4712413.1 hypothetical protein [Pseudorhodoplanes sp.]GIK81707.1 MAG: hypothetical protein BroJett024_28120 [Alphaproteobacteria bacterium]